MENHSHYVTTQQYGRAEEVRERTESMLLKREETGQTEGLADEYPPLEKKIEFSHYRIPVRIKN